MRTNAQLFAQQLTITPEHKIWRAVLEQAYLDAELPLQADGSEPMERTLARIFLSTDDLALALVCDFAEIPRDRLLAWAQRRFSQGPETSLHVGDQARSSSFHSETSPPATHELIPPGEVAAVERSGMRVEAGDSGVSQ